MGRLVRQALRAAGVTAIFGAPLDPIPVTVVDPWLAPVLALAHERVFGGRAAVHAGSGSLVLGGRRALQGPASGGGGSLEVRQPGELEAVLAQMISGSPGDHVPGRVPEVSCLRLGLDPGAPAPAFTWPQSEPAPRWCQAPDDLVHRLRAARSPVLLAGPGVVTAGVIPELHALAAAANLGVLNTWGAKGIFDFHSRHHWATVGLQAHDLELGGLEDADAVVTVGLDEWEVLGAPPMDRWHVLQPNELGWLGEHWSRDGPELPVPPLRARLADVTQRGWGVGAGPMPPSRVTLGYSTMTRGWGMVAADPGVGGYWVARTFPTSRPGEALVPAEGNAQGFSLAAALLARRRDPLAPVVAVADAPLLAVHHALLELAASWGVPLVAEVWDDQGAALAPGPHAERLTQALRSGRTAVVHLATAHGQLEAMVAAAGPVVAWGAKGLFQGAGAS